MLVGCKELIVLNSVKATIEGDSFLKIQWGSAFTSYLWRTVEWVEEIWFISSTPDFSFSHVCW